MTAARLIDCLHLGRERVIGCWQVGDALIDPGPESCIETLLAGVEGELRRLLLTHIHLDHAGASGALVERFPELEVYVHEAGAPHLADPAKLLRSAGRLYGERMEKLWGRVVPIPERNIRVLGGGERFDGWPGWEGIGPVEVAYTPGHASHHVSYLIGGVAYVGDTGGVRIAPCDFILPPTPPPDIDVELWLESLERLRAWRPRRLVPTHFGAVEEPEAHLDLLAARLRESAESVRSAGSPEEWAEAVTERIRAEAGPAAEAYLQAAPPDQLYQGLERYWRKRQEQAA